MLSSVNSDIFTSSKSIKMTPAIFAEWNQNIFNPPYATVAGIGVKENNISTSTNLINITGTGAKSGFITKKFVMTANQDKVSYTVTPSATSSAFKIITYVKTNKDYPIIANISARGSSSQFGSSSIEVNSFGWTKVETYIGGSSSSDNITSFTYDIVLNRLSSQDALPIDFIFTVPEVYATTYFDYQYNSMWPSDCVFTNFRPGESYVNTGSSKFSFPNNFRKLDSTIALEILNGYTSDAYMPVSSIIQNPQLINVAAPVPFYKNGLLSDMNQYKYFVSDTTNKSITAFYDKSGIITNKLVLKFNTLMATPVINIYIDDALISVDGSTSVNLALNVNKENGGVREDAGVLVLYWNGTGWTRTRWTNVPTFNTNGSLTNTTTIKKIRVTQVSNTVRSQFSSYSSTSLTNDLLRMQVIEISPRVEVDLTNYVKSISVNKSLDSKDNYLPISAINSDDMTITLAGMPIGNISSFVPIFSSQSNNANTVLKGMLRKNIKIYSNFYLEGYFDDTTKTYISPNVLIPAGTFYSDTWEESDIEEISIQAYDIGRYLQSTPVSDYVSNLRTVIDVVSNMLDLSGFTDYDYNSLYSVCNDKNIPLDLAYFYVNSKDTTIIDAIDQIFLPYQIGAYIDEYGVMKFLSLPQILSSTTSDITISESNIIDGGYSVTNKAKPGKISLRYQTPKIKQTLALQNLLLEASSPSFVYTTSSDVLWSQQNVDSVGMNYLNSSMNDTQNYFVMDSNSLFDIFHTYNLNSNGYVSIENEIVSFLYKEYNIEDATNNVTVNVKNDIELAAEIDRFNKKYKVGLKTSDGTTKSEYNTIIGPTGKITNVQRGMFGTKVADHTVLDSFNSATKNISCQNLSSAYAITGTGSYTTANNEFLAATPASGKTLFYPTTERSTVVTDSGTEYYKTYSAKFNLKDNFNTSSGGIFFNLGSSLTNANGAYFVELVKYNTKKSDGSWNSPAVYNYALVFYTVTSGAPSIYAYANVTSTVNNIIANFEKVLDKQPEGSDPLYIATVDERYASFNLRVTTYKSYVGDGENPTPTNLVSIFLNNVEITGWMQNVGAAWDPYPVNSITGLPKRLRFQNDITSGSVFGSFISTNPVAITGITYQSQSSGNAGAVREIYATYKSLKERSVNYYFQDREFLNGMIQNQNIFSKSKSYMMQTKPEVIGINTYDVQYTTPAAVSADVLPVEYLLQYFPGTDVVDKQYLQKKEVDEYSLSYSTILNTGFRAKFAIANNSSHMVFLKKDSTEIMPVTVVLNLWTQEIIAPSDPEIIEKTIDPSNLSETIQLDSNWIQSKESANKLINTIAKGIDNFSKDVTIQIFGNPLIQIGDTIELTYNLPGLNQQKYIVHSVSHEFDSGLSTTLKLNMVDSGVTTGTPAETSTYWISAYNQTARGVDTDVDSEANVVLVGGYYTTKDIMMVTKYNKDRTVLWQKTIGNSYSTFAHSVDIDVFDNIYVSGMSGNGTNYDAVIIKMDSAGNILWQRKIAAGITTLGTSANANYIPRVYSDSLGNVYFAGSIQSTNQTFLIKYNSSGSILWQKIVSSSANPQITVDPSDNIYIQLYSSSAPHILKYNSSGVLQWKQRYFQTGDNLVPFGGIKSDQSGNVYLSFTRIGSGIQHNNLFKINSSGAYVWQKEFTSTVSYGNGLGVDVDTSGNIYWIGERNDVDMIAKLDNGGNLLWQRTLSVNQNVGNIRAISTFGNYYYVTTNWGINSISPIVYLHKLPGDGSLTGTYSVGALTVTYQPTTFTMTNTSYSVATSSVTEANGSLVDSSDSLTSTNSTATTTGVIVQ